MQSIFTVTENKLLARSTMKITLKGDTSLITRAGQFVNIKLEGCYLRRPISVCTKNDTSMTLIYKIVGKGTQILSKVCPGDKLDLLTGLGNGFDTSVKCISPLLVGGGAGCAPLFMLAETLKKEGKIPSAVLGFNTKDEIFLKDELESIGVKTFIATYDASEGTKGFVTDAIIKNNIETDYIFACGPYPMLKTLCEKTDCPAQISLEERMGCGFGACMGCSINTKNGYKRVCKEGPVFLKEEIIWQ